MTTITIDRLTTPQRRQVEAIKRKLHDAEDDVLERIAILNDPANGPLAIRIIAAVETR